MSNLAMMMGLGSGAGGVSIADVFSTDLYTSDGNNRDVVNGVDLAGEGGLVWFKGRNVSGDHALYDTERGVLKTLSTNTTGYEVTDNSSLTAFNSDGYSIGTNGTVNYSSGNNYVSWTWRQAPNYFDVVQYSGDSNATQDVAHNLGVSPGAILQRNIGRAGQQWSFWHKSVSDKSAYFNTTDAFFQTGGGLPFYIGQDVSDTTFRVSSDGYDYQSNRSGDTYIAYLFADNEDLIKCGSYTGTGSSGNAVNVGFQPQWLLIKQTNGANEWFIWDAARGSDELNTGNDATLLPAKTNVEATGADYLDFTSTGFTLNLTGGATNGSGSTYIYIAIKAE